MRRLRQIGASAERSETSAEDSETATTLGAARDWAPTGRSGPTSWAGLPPAPSSSRCSPPLSLVVSCVGGERFWEILASSGQVGQIGHFSGGFWDEPFPQPRLGEAGFRFLVDSPLDRSAAGAPYLSAALAETSRSRSAQVPACTGDPLNWPCDRREITNVVSSRLEAAGSVGLIERVGDGENRQCCAGEEAAEGEDCGCG